MSLREVHLPQALNDVAISEKGSQATLIVLRDCFVPRNELCLKANII